MKRAVRRLQLQREIVLITRQPGEFLSTACHNAYSSVALLEILVGVRDRFANFTRRTPGGIYGEVVAKEAAGAVDHVALRATGFAEEERFAFNWIARQRRGVLPALQTAQVRNDRFDFRIVERSAESRHLLRRRPILDDARNVRVGQPPSFRPRGNVRPALAAAAIQPMAARASCREYCSPSSHGFGICCGRRLCQWPPP